jgi:HAD superfamily phosphoserine phosphatase-like hydrolase
MNVYDFDNTIYDGESCFDFFMYYLKKSPRLVSYLPRLTVAFAKYKRGNVTVEQALEKYAPEVEEFFRSIEDIDAGCAEFWDKNIKKIKPFYKELRREDDLIITASPDFSIAEICKRLGIDNFIASEIDLETGRIIRLNMRSEKIVSFKEKYPDAVIDCFYTDSPKNDKPLIDLAKRAFIVKGNRIVRIK